MDPEYKLAANSVGTWQDLHVWIERRGSKRHAGEYFGEQGAAVNVQREELQTDLSGK